MIRHLIFNIENSTSYSHDSLFNLYSFIREFESEYLYANYKSYFVI